MAIRLSEALRNFILETGSVEAALTLGFLIIYSGSQPASANDAATGTQLAVIANADGATGLTFEAIATAGTLPKTSGETWSGTAGASGTAGWFRFAGLDTDKATTVANASAGGVGFRAMDGSIAVTGGDINMSNVSVITSALQTITVFNILQPAS
jgi:hypothetical protein